MNLVAADLAPNPDPEDLRPSRDPRDDHLGLAPSLAQGGSLGPAQEKGLAQGLLSQEKALLFLFFLTFFIQA